MSTQSRVDGAYDAAKSRPMGWVARTGLTARAAIYLIMGWLAILVAQGEHAKVDQRGALTTVLNQPFGTLLVWLLAAGFVAYAVWRFSEAAFGVTGEPDGVVPRLKSLVRGIAYSIFAFTALSVLHGVRQSQSRQQASLAEATLGLTGGQILVGLVGLGFVIAGALMVWEGITTKFIRYFEYLPPLRRRVVVILGRVGTVARGVVFAFAGLLVVGAALWSEASRAGGINEVVQEALAHSYGDIVVAAMGIGFIVFGIYGLAEAAWRRVPDGGSA